MARLFWGRIGQETETIRGHAGSLKKRVVTKLTAVPERTKYLPHQGKREVARRLRQQQNRGK